MGDFAARNTSIKNKDQATALLLNHLNELKELASDFKSKFNLDIADLLSEKTKQTSIQIPVSVFDTDKLSSLEIIVKYLKENRGKSYHEIAILLNRDDRTIWATYDNSLKKLKLKLKEKPGLAIPIQVFADRKLSTLENLVIYLKDIAGLSVKQISQLLRKNVQTIYTTYRRGMSK